MDIELQLEKAENNPAPSLVGSSMRSSDDSPHNNYIHPEKYKETESLKNKRYSVLNTNVTASLDDLINEGALMNSEEDFAKFLNDDGLVKEDAKYVPSEEDEESGSPKAKIDDAADTVQNEESDANRSVDKTIEEESNSTLSIDEPKTASPPISSPADGYSIHKSVVASPLKSSMYSAQEYSAPNLSEYQLDNQITEHDQLLRSVEYPNSKQIGENYDDDEVVPEPSDPQVPDSVIEFDSQFTVPAGAREGGDSPFISSRSESVTGTNLHSRSSSSFNSKPHLARGDSYQNTVDGEPSTYQSPPISNLENNDDEESFVSEELERRSRQSKPTLGDRLANKEVLPKKDGSLYTPRSQSSTNYLRAISRSRSRPPSSLNHEVSKEELRDEGALLSDDPYQEVNDLDAQVEKILHLDDHSSQAEFSVIKEEDDDVEDHEPEKVVESKDKEIEEANAVETENISREEATEAASSDTNSIDSSKDSEDKIEQSDPSTHLGGGKTSTPLVEETKNLESNYEIANDSKEPDDIHPKLAKAIDDQIENTENSKTEASEIEPAKDDAKEITDELNEANVDPEIEVTTKEPVDINITPVDEAATEKSEKSGGVSETTEAPLEGEKDIEAVSNLPLETFKEEESKDEEAKSDESEDPEISTGEPKVGDKEEEENEADESSHETSEVIHQTSKDIPEKEREEVSKPDENDLKTVEATGAASVKVDDDGDLDMDNLDISPAEMRKHLESLPIYIYTSLAGGFQIISRTNRLSTILQANQIKFECKDLGTDDEAKKIWRRNAKGRTLPAVIREDEVIGNWQEIDEANEEYKVQELLYETF